MRCYYLQSFSSGGNNYRSVRIESPMFMTLWFQGQVGMILATSVTRSISVINAHELGYEQKTLEEEEYVTFTPKEGENQLMEFGRASVLVKHIRRQNRDSTDLCLLFTLLRCCYLY